MTPERKAELRAFECQCEHRECSTAVKNALDALDAAEARSAELESAMRMIIAFTADAESDGNGAMSAFRTARDALVKS